MSKPTFVYYLAGGCAGCDTSLLDTSKSLLEFLEKVELKFFGPTLADFKYEDLESLPDGSVDFGFFSGNVRNSEHEHFAKVLRRKCKVLVAFGTCASVGGIKGLVNYFPQGELLKKAYVETYTTDNPEGVLPSPKCVVDGKYELELPKLQEAKALDQVVEVDYFVGGCPPSYKHIKWVLLKLLSGELPPKGSWLTMGKAVCDVCPRNPIKSGGVKKKPTEVKRVLGRMPEEGCLLELGYLCLGPVTLGDCGAACLKVNVPCRGCAGPIPGVKDFGVKAMSTVATAYGTPEVLKKIPDPVRLFYRYSLPKATLLKRR
jgi:F420-non-reducing hydrogenase small subunit